MAIGMLLAGEAITQDSYTGLTKKMFGSYPMREDQSPEGLMLHTAGQSDQGWYVYDVWESKEHFQRFVQDKLGPAIKELGAGGERAATAVLPGRDARQGACAVVSPAVRRALQRSARQWPGCGIRSELLRGHS